MTKQGMINIAGASEGRIAPIIANLRKDKKGQLDRRFYAQQSEAAGIGPFFF